MAKRPFPAASPHGAIEEQLSDVFFVSGGVRMAPGMSFSRNMTIVRDGTTLILVNTMRLGDAGLAALDKLGKVEHVVRLAGFHGMDDPFYKERYGAQVWNVQGQIYAKGFDAQKPNVEPYFAADHEMTVDTELPIPGASLYRFDSALAGEGLVVMDRDGGIAISGDSLQNWNRTDEFFSLPARVMMKLMGFIKPHNVGPGWLKAAKPDPADVRGVLELSFEHLLPSHGAQVIGNAKELYRPAIDRVTRVG